jgi:hypothetical protein
MKTKDVLKDTVLAADICHRDWTTAVADTLLKSDTFGDIIAARDGTWTPAELLKDHS